MKAICEYFGRSPQGYYKSMKSERRSWFEDDIIIKLVQEKRKLLPFVGGKKLYYMLNADFTNLGIKIGRDKFFDILRQNHLLIKRRRRHVKTTNSRHWFRRHSNLVKGLQISYPNHVFVADITYIRVQESFMFLSLVTDYYSRKIVGYSLNRSLSTDGPLIALRMALRGVDNPEKLIHHSDRGIQYCSHRYTKLLSQRGIRISMTEEDHVYENAVAERVNGILKQEFMLDRVFKTEKIAHDTVKEAIESYNNYRPHLSLDYNTPEARYVA